MLGAPAAFFSPRVSFCAADIRRVRRIEVILRAMHEGLHQPVENVLGQVPRTRAHGYHNYLGNEETASFFLQMCLFWLIRRLRYLFAALVCLLFLPFYPVCSVQFWAVFCAIPLVYCWCAIRAGSEVSLRRRTKCFATVLVSEP